MSLGSASPKFKESKGKVVWVCGSLFLPSEEAAVYGPGAKSRAAILPLFAQPLPADCKRIFCASRMQSKPANQPAVIPLGVIFPCDVCGRCKIRASASRLHPVLSSNVTLPASSALQLPATPHTLSCLLSAIHVLSQPRPPWGCAFNRKYVFTPFGPELIFESALAIFPGTACYCWKDSPWKCSPQICFASW